MSFPANIIVFEVDPNDSLVFSYNKTRNGFRKMLQYRKGIITIGSGTYLNFNAP